MAAQAARFRRNSPTGRVVYRSNNNANANGGVSYANANNDSSNANANIGSRLANNSESTGVQQWIRVSDVEPGGMSLAKSTRSGGKGKNGYAMGNGVW